MSGEVEAGGMSPEQAADFAALQAAANEQEAEAAALVAEPAGPDPAEEAKAAFGLVVGLLSPLLPYLPAIYTDDALSRLAGAYVPVAEKYGWNMGGMFDQYGAEIVLAGVALPLVAQTRNVHIAWAAERAAREKADKPGALPAAPVSQDAPRGHQAVQFGTAQPVEAAA